MTAEAIICYERDEARCEEPMCARVGCVLRNDRLAPSSTATTEALALADWIEQNGTLYFNWEIGVSHDTRIARAKLIAAALRSCHLAQGSPERGGDDPYITDLQFANEQNIKAARKYKARLDFMEAKHGAIDWDGEECNDAQPTQGGDKGDAVAWAVFAANGNIRMWSTINADVEGFAKQIGAVVTPLYAAPQPASNADMARLSASEVACYKWPEDTAEHRALRAAFMDGAVAHAGGDANTAKDPDEDHPDCVTDRECELYDALMGLASHAAAYRDDYRQWTQGGVTLEPIVAKALRLLESLVPSTDREGGK